MEFGILGPLVVVTEDGERPVGSTKARTVLGLLLIRANQVVSTETLVDALWEETPPRSAVATLQTYVYQLRKNLDLDTIRTRPTGYMLEVPRIGVDTLRFEDAVGAVAGTRSADPKTAVRVLTEALQWWRGRALADFDGAVWARGKATRLELLRADAIERLIDARLACGDHHGGTQELEALVVEHPLRERFWAQLMLALYRSDRQAEALRAYTRLREQLRDELGLEPSRDLGALETAILAHAPELAAPVDEPRTSSDSAPAAPRRKRAGFAIGLAVATVVASTSVILAKSTDDGSPPARAPSAGYRPLYRKGPCPAVVLDQFDSSAQCGTLTVPESRNRPGGRTITLGVFRFPARSEHPAADPVVQLGNDFRLTEVASDTALRTRGDSIYLAGRGFFGSKPRLTCPEVNRAVTASLGRRLRDPVTTTEYVRAAERCRKRWIAEGVDLSAYSREERADDVRDLAQVLHLSRVNLVAGGATTADAGAEIAGKYPQLVRSITLFNVTPDSVSANRWNGAITNAAGALDRYFGECTNQAACNATYPKLRRRLVETIDRLDAAPQTHIVAHPYNPTHERVSVLLDGDRAMQLALRALNDPSALPFVPVAIASATSGAAVADFAARQVTAPDDASWGALLSRVCIDEIATVGHGGLSLEAQAEPRLAFMADDPIFAVCDIWKARVARSRAPGPGTTPTLILQGEIAPFTSREWAQQTAQSFGNATVVYLPHLGGVASSTDPCVTKLRAGFLANPRRRVSEAACARAIRTIDFAGT